MERLFLDWRRPCLAAAVDYLAQRFLQRGRFDLGGVLVALPGGRAMRRLEELLVEEAEVRGATLIPPRLTTIGGLPEMLYTRRKPFAEDLVQRLAWVDALRAAGERRLEPLLRTLPEPDDLRGWLSLARMVSALHRELAADGLDFADVLREGGALPAFQSEIPRWEVLTEVQRRYLARLDALDLWDRQTARLFAIKHAECRADGPIVLAGLVDLNRAQRRILDQVSEQVTALVLADESWAERFDAHGCLISERWKDIALDLPDEAIELADSAEDQADAVLRAVAAWGERRSAEEIVVGVPDERIVPHILQRMAECGLSSRYGVGRTIAQTGPYRLLAAVARVANDRDFASLAALARHPGVEDVLRARGVSEEYLSAFDQVQREKVPFQLPKEEPAAPVEGDNQFTACLLARDAMEQLAGDLLSVDRRPLAAWADPVVDLLLAIYGGRPLVVAEDSDRITAEACEAVRGVLDGWDAVPASLMPDVSAADAIELLLAEVQNGRIPAARGDEDIEILGWLELTMDDAPALVLTGMNEGIVPSCRNSDPFLPNRLRRILGIEDNDRRYARDAYTLGVLRYSKEDFRIIAGRRSVEEDPLHPSRLLFACDDATMTRRVAAFFAEGNSPRFAPLGGLRGGRTNTALCVPRPEVLAAELVAEEIASMRVTEFKDYLACPYRYFLRHRMKIDTMDDAAVELDAAAFGSLAHDVLETLGSGETGDLPDPDDEQGLLVYLSARLDAIVRERFDPFPRAAVRIQVEQLRRRLGAFAAAQAAVAAEGWRIFQTEVPIESDSAVITVDGRPMRLRGRIDRIDRNERTGRWRIIDYKTGDAGKGPEQTHRRSGEWVDLQLPLYAHLLPSLGIEFVPEEVELGYFLLPKKLPDTRFVAADWREDDFLRADETAYEVIRRLRGDPDNRYWPPATQPPPFTEVYSSICQDRRFGAAVHDEEVEAAD